MARRPFAPAGVALISDGAPCEHGYLKCTLSHVAPAVQELERHAICPTCGFASAAHVVWDCGDGSGGSGDPYHQEHRAAWLAKQQQAPSGEWTHHERCSDGWSNCWHLAGSSLHVAESFGGRSYVIDRPHGIGRGALHCGMLAACKAWVEQRERRVSELDKPVGVAPQDALPPGWITRAQGATYDWDHVATGAGVNGVAFGLFSWTETQGRISLCVDRKPTREEAMAASLGYRVLETEGVFLVYWRDKSHAGGPFKTALEAAVFALMYDAVKRGLA